MKQTITAWISRVTDYNSDAYKAFDNLPDALEHARREYAYLTDRERKDHVVSVESYAFPRPDDMPEDSTVAELYDEALNNDDVPYDPVEYITVPLRPTDRVSFRTEVDKWTANSGYEYTGEIIADETGTFGKLQPEMENIVPSESIEDGTDYVVRMVIYTRDEYGEIIDVLKAECWATEWYAGTATWTWEEA